MYHQGTNEKKLVITNIRLSGLNDETFVFHQLVRVCTNINKGKYWMETTFSVET